MIPERWQIVKEVFQSALLQDKTQRAAYLDGMCSADPSLRAEVEDMLASDEQAASFMEAPVFEVAPDLLEDGRAELPVGRTIGHYRILSKLGAGGMGEVYLAQHTTLDRKVALKVLSPAIAGDRHSRTRLVREARLTSALDHPNVCTIYEVGAADGNDFISMQYVEGDTLKRVIDGRPLGLPRLLSISLQVAGALQAAHAQGIVHRDINSRNIMITPTGQAKVLDFGLAKREDLKRSGAGNDLTQSGAAFGTPASMSPEQARGERADHRSDIFSFGVVLYEMAAGQLPFKRESAVETMSAIIHEPHPPIGESNAQAPPGLAAIIDRALAKDPARRYPSMQDMLADLRELAQANEVVDSPALYGAAVPSAALPWETEQRPGRLRMARSSGRGFAFIALAVASVVAIVIAFSRLGSGSRDIDSLAVLPFIKRSAADMDYLSEGITESLINQLSRLPKLRVMAESTVAKYRGRRVDPRVVGQDLRVRGVLTGSVEQRGDRLVIHIELVNAADGSRLWGDRYVRALSEVPALPADLAIEASRRLRLQLTGEERHLLAKRYTGNTAAYHLYLKGRYFSNRRTLEGYRKAIDYFQQAIEEDPSYALAYAGMADCYNLMGGWQILPPGESFPKARAAAERALHLDDSIAEAHTSLAFYRSYSGDWRGAEAEYKRAIQLNPNSDTAHRWYGSHLAAVGRLDDGMAETRRAQELDPLSLNNNTQVGRILYLMRQYDDALAQYEKALEIDPNFAHAHFLSGWVYEKKRMFADALASYERAAALGARATTARIGRVYALSGHKREAYKVLARLKELTQQTYVPPYDFALIYAGLDDRKQALAWLEKVINEGAGRNWLKMDPTWDSLRPDPAFQQLLRRLSLPP